MSLQSERIQLLMHRLGLTVTGARLPGSERASRPKEPAVRRFSGARAKPPLKDTLKQTVFRKTHWAVSLGMEVTFCFRICQSGGFA